MYARLRQSYGQTSAGAPLLPLGCEAIFRASPPSSWKDGPQEQANVKSLLLLFAFVPEDTRCPLEVLLLMFKAVHEGSAVTMMHLRKWMRILVNRSLVLGTIDRPSVHDATRMSP